MAQVRDFRNGFTGSTEDAPWTTVKVCDSVGFKSDHEQYGKIVKIEGNRLFLHNPNGFGGDYLRYATDTVECAGDCWID